MKGVDEMLLAGKYLRPAPLRDEDLRRDSLSAYPGTFDIQRDNVRTGSPNIYSEK
jgi:hypothetical protein